MGRVAVDNPDIAHFSVQIVYIFHEQSRLGCAKTCNNGIAVLNERQRLFQSDYFRRVIHNDILLDKCTDGGKPTACTIIRDQPMLASTSSRLMMGPCSS